VTTLFIRVDGKPIAQPRPRARNAGKHARVYSPKKVKRKGVYVDNPIYIWRELITKAARMNRPSKPMDCPVRVDLVFLFERPQRMMRRKDPEGRMWHTAKPDRDNIDKPVIDCLKNDGWFVDDSHVCAGEILKLYCAKGEEPGLLICIAPILTEPGSRRLLRPPEPAERADPC